MAEDRNLSIRTGLFILVIVLDLKRKHSAVNESSGFNCDLLSTCNCIDWCRGEHCVQEIACFCMREILSEIDDLLQ